MSAQMRAADRQHAEYAIIIGEDELTRAQAKVRNMATKEESDIALDAVVSYLKEA
jgi:histidyl-tRNA synthetase